jgi:hypothetical protein
MAHRPPAWHRLRGLVILGQFAIAFLFGHDMTSAVGLPADPTFVVAGRLLGPHGVELLGAIAALLSIGNWGIRAWGPAPISARTPSGPQTRSAIGLSSMAHTRTFDIPFIWAMSYCPLVSDR